MAPCFLNHDYSHPMTVTRQPLSAVLITHNAVSQLPACIDSVAFCDEIVVVDSGSTDGTVELAQRRGARVIHQEWLGYGPQKKFAVERATHDWVLCVDADERVSDAPTAQAFRFARCNRFMGRYLRHGEGYPDWSLRLFNRHHARWSDDAVHEKVITEGEVGTLPGDLLHDSAETLESYLAKQERYTTLAARESLAQGRRVTLAHMVLSPAIRFIKFYFLRLGFLDGWPGLMHILIGCRNSYTKYAKMRSFRAGRQ
jgi:glycosyltransferase involved in cell wall biosynthesis